MKTYWKERKPLICVLIICSCICLLIGLILVIKPVNIRNRRNRSGVYDLRRNVFHDGVLDELRQKFEFERRRTKGLEKRRILNVIEEKTGIKLEKNKESNNNRNTRKACIKRELNNRNYSRLSSYRLPLRAMTNIYSRRRRDGRAMYPEVYNTLGYLRDNTKEAKETKERKENTSNRRRS
jgi:hypothetical protein